MNAVVKAALIYGTVVATGYGTVKVYDAIEENARLKEAAAQREAALAARRNKPKPTDTSPRKMVDANAIVKNGFLVIVR